MINLCHDVNPAYQNFVERNLEMMDFHPSCSNIKMSIYQVKILSRCQAILSKFFLKCHSKMSKFCQDVNPSSQNFVKISLQHVKILSTCQSIKSKFCQHVTPACQNFVNMSLQHVKILSTCLSSMSKFCQHVNPSCQNFVNMSLQHVKILSTCQFMITFIFTDATSK